MSQRDKDVTFFVVWTLNKAAAAWNKTPAQIYDALQKAGAVDEYLVRFYDIVHSMGERAILNDLEGLLISKGITL